jgi:hypothetical protein
MHLGKVGLSLASLAALAVVQSSVPARADSPFWQYPWLQPVRPAVALAPATTAKPPVKQATYAVPRPRPAGCGAILCGPYFVIGLGF